MNEKKKERKKEGKICIIQNDITSLFNSDVSTSINVAQLLFEPFHTASKALSKWFCNMVSLLSLPLTPTVKEDTGGRMDG